MPPAGRPPPTAAWTRADAGAAAGRPAGGGRTYGGFVQDFDGARLGHVVLPQGLLQQLERRTLPFPKDH